MITIKLRKIQLIQRKTVRPVLHLEPIQTYIILSLCKKCSSTEFFLVHIFPYLHRIRKNMDKKKLRIWTLFTQCAFC